MSERHTQLLQEEKLLRKQNRLNNEFVSACRLGNLDLIKKHVDMGHDVNNKNEDGKTGLMTATLHEQLHVVSYLIQQRATDVSIIGGHYDGWNALHYAARYNTKDVDILRLLLNRKPPGHMHITGRREVINKMDKDGYTPLDRAYARNIPSEKHIRGQIITVLKEFGGKANAYDKNGMWVGKGNGDLNTVK